MDDTTETQEPADDNVEVTDVPLGVPAGDDPSEDDESPGFPEGDPTEG